MASQHLSILCPRKRTLLAGCCWNSTGSGQSVNKVEVTGRLCGNAAVRDNLAQAHFRTHCSTFFPNIVSS